MHIYGVVYVARVFFAPAAPPEKKHLEKAGFTHIYGGGGGGGRSVTAVWGSHRGFARWEF